MFGQGGIGQMENNGEKMSLCVVWLGGGEKNFQLGPSHFPPRPTLNSSLQNGEKRGMKTPVEVERQK